MRFLFLVCVRKLFSVYSKFVTDYIIFKHMFHGFRYVWSHGITPRKSDIVPSPGRGLTLSQRGVRTSFTFRKITGVKPEQQRYETLLL